MKINFLRHLPRVAVLLAACLGLIATSQVKAQGASDPREFQETPYFLVMLVQATALDYQNTQSLLRSLYKSQQKSGGFLGHSWVLLSGIEQGRRQVTEAGLSPKGPDSMQFFRGVLDLEEYGYANPTEEQKSHPRFEPDPISYLWRDHGNGFLQPAREANVRPTFAAKVDLDADQYYRIKARLDPKLPSHKSFQLTGQQCSSFVVELAALAGVDLKHQVTIPVPREVRFSGRQVRLWSDPKYSSLTLSSPDVIEAELKQLVASGRAVDALPWYFATRPGSGSSNDARSRTYYSPQRPFPASRVYGLAGLAGSR